jgi:hypothetical protein
MPTIDTSQIEKGLSEEEIAERENVLSSWVDEIDTQLEGDVSNRLYGISSRITTRGGFRMAGYQNLRYFFDGDQWSAAKPSGGTMKTYNYCATTVFNYTAFMAGESPEFDIPPSDITDDVEVALAEQKELLLKTILDANQFSIMFEESVMVGSELGDSFIVGPFWNETKKKIWFAPVRRPEFIRPIFNAAGYNEIVGFIWHYRITRDRAMELYGDEIKKRKINLDEAVGNDNEQETSREMIDFMQYWDSEEMTTKLNGHVVEYKNHKYGFVPLQYVRNIINPNYPFGISDIENMLDAQTEYNEAASYTADVLKAVAIPHIFGSNININEYEAGVAQIIDVGEDGTLFPNPMANLSAPWEVYLGSRQRDVFALSGVNEIMYGGARVREATGRALSVLMQGVQNRIRGRQERWRVALRHLAAGIFRLVEMYVEDGKELIQGNYDSDVFFPATLMRNVAQEIDKFNAKLQSMTTTMKNLGVPSPVREKKLMAKELEADPLMVEISRNPMLQIQLKQLVAQSQVMPGQPMGGGEATPGPEGSAQEMGAIGEEARPRAARGVPVGSPRRVSPTNT